MEVLLSFQGLPYPGD